MRVLDNKGAVLDWSGRDTNAFCRSGQTGPSNFAIVRTSESFSGLSDDIVKSEQLVVVFETSSDGRGFSWPHHLRTRYAYRKALYAGGAINPQQVAQAFQVGFDGIVISEDAWVRYGEDQWRAAGAAEISLSYANYARAGMQSIWRLRGESIRDTK